MKSITAILKSEIARLVKKEVGAAMKSLKGEISEFKNSVSKTGLAKGAKRRRGRAAPIGNERGLSPSGIKKIRKKLKLSRKDFARQLDVSLGAVVAWERGRFLPRPRVQERITSLAVAGVSTKKNGDSPNQQAGLKPSQIKKTRKKLKLSQKDFARRLNVSTGAVAGWEGGKYSPRSGIQEKILSLTN
ncbi:MAG: helix-turn-helix domain-containing protein [Nitrospinae bacterium]|nr:helix-turn-helix domain-containing protein [Nitrospinota bacterium]